LVRAGDRTRLHRHGESCSFATASLVVILFCVIGGQTSRERRVGDELPPSHMSPYCERIKREEAERAKRQSIRSSTTQQQRVQDNVNSSTRASSTAGAAEQPSSPKRSRTPNRKYFQFTVFTNCARLRTCMESLRQRDTHQQRGASLSDYTCTFLCAVCVCEWSVLRMCIQKL
jgi:hypothetical protein